jgi:hypothetical protein
MDCTKLGGIFSDDCAFSAKNTEGGVIVARNGYFEGGYCFGLSVASYAGFCGLIFLRILPPSVQKPSRGCEGFCIEGEELNERRL